MPHYSYLIIGGGMTAAAAIAGIREEDESGSIGVLAAESNPPYNRPPLSKQLWTGKRTVPDIWRQLPENVTLHQGSTAQSLDVSAREIVDDQGEKYTYDRLLLATGGTPRRLPFGNDQIIYYRTLDTYYRLRKLADNHDRFAVIGGGFIGSEVAAALAMNGKQVTLLFPEDGIGSRIFPAELAGYLNRYYREKGVEVCPGEMVTAVEGHGTSLTVQTENGLQLDVQGVVAGIGITPNVALAEAAGLDVADGIVVDSSLRTSQPDVYAAGDVASFWDPVLEQQRRVEHEDAANSMGRVAGRAMAGADVTYDNSPMFYSDLFDLGYEAIGQLDSRLETVCDWQEPYRKGVVYYLDEGRIRGVLLWNVWDKVDAARDLIAGSAVVERDRLPGLL